MLWNEYPSTADYSYVSPDQAIGGHQETNPDVCVAGPVSTPPPAGTEVFKPCQPLLFSSSNRSCTQVVTFLYGRLLCCSGLVPEGKAEAAYQSGERVRNLQNKLGSEPSVCSLREWFSWFLLSVCSLWQWLGCLRWWEVIYSAVDVGFACMRSCVGLYDHKLMGLGRTEDGCPRVGEVRKLSVLHWTSMNPVVLKIKYCPLHM